MVIHSSILPGESHGQKRSTVHSVAKRHSGSDLALALALF